MAVSPSRHTTEFAERLSPTLNFEVQLGMTNKRSHGIKMETQIMETTGFIKVIAPKMTMYSIKNLG